jgi:hypothetical protein
MIVADAGKIVDFYITGMNSREQTRCYRAAGSQDVQLAEEILQVGYWPPDRYCRFRLKE